MNKKISNIVENHDGTQDSTSQGLEAEIVGSGFVAGPETNIEIDRLRGKVSGTFAGRMLVDTGVTELQPGTDYINDDAACIELLDELGLQILILPTVPKKRSKKFVQEWVAVFEIADRLYVTEPQESEHLAAACCLLFVLSK